jgi:hypothetical protein
MQAIMIVLGPVRAFAFVPHDRDALLSDTQPVISMQMRFSMHISTRILLIQVEYFVHLHETETEDYVVDF